jgi:hypothetical protein
MIATWTVFIIDCNSMLTLLIVQEDFIAFRCCGNLRYCVDCDVSLQLPIGGT